MEINQQFPFIVRFLLVSIYIKTTNEWSSESPLSVCINSYSKSMIHTLKSRRELLYKLINLFNLAEKKNCYESNLSLETDTHNIHFIDTV